MARPITQEARRRDIVDAAMQALIASDGDEVSIADVARHLSLTPNAVRYYYRDVDALLWAVRERAVERFMTGRVRAVAALDDPREQIVRAIEIGLPNGPEDAEWRVTFRPVMGGRITPQFGELISDIFNVQVAIYEDLLVAGAESGIFTLAAPAADVARTLMVMEDYLGFRIVAFDPSFTREIAIRLMRQYAAQFTGCELPDSVGPAEPSDRDPLTEPSGRSDS